MLNRVVLVAATVSAAAACGVQPSGPPAPTGLRLRITHWESAPGQASERGAPATHEGRLIFASYDSVVVYSLRERREVAVAVQEISRLEIYRGQRGSAEAAVKGAAKGALLGAGAGAAVGASTAVMGAILGRGEDAGKQIVAGAAGGAVIGAAGGAYAGATEGDPVWQEITIRRLLQDLCRCQEPERARPDTTIIAAPETS